VWARTLAARPRASWPTQHIPMVGFCLFHEMSVRIINGLCKHGLYSSWWGILYFMRDGGGTRATQGSPPPPLRVWRELEERS